MILVAGALKKGAPCFGNQISDQAVDSCTRTACKARKGRLQLLAAAERPRPVKASDRD